MFKRVAVYALGLIVASLPILAQGPTWTEKFPANSPPAMANHAMAYDAARGEVVLFGGAIGGGIVFDDTWVWGGTDWTQKFPVSRPPTMAGHAMTYDAARGDVVLYGGSETLDPSETWVWNGSTWTQKFPTNNPSAFELQGHAMAYDGAREEVVLFGGQISGGGPFNHTWVWDGINWNQRFPTNSPSPRAFHSMTYDPSSGQIVLFGGESLGAIFGDTWVWDGTNWTQEIPANSPSARTRHVTAYDAARAEVVLFGGVNFSDWQQDTWLWDGTDWTPCDGSAPAICTEPTDKPPSREASAMAYDAGHGEAVLFGGLRGFTLFDDTWVWDGGAAGCTVSSIDIDSSFSNGVISASFVNASVCEGTLTLRNEKKYWTNFTISTVGSVTVEPVGGNLNLYAKFGLLPPASFFPLPPGDSTSFTLRFSGPGELVTIFTDPTIESGDGAGIANVMQVILNVLPFGGTPTFAIDIYQETLEAFSQMPHLHGAVTAWFQPRPQVVQGVREFWRFIRSEEEQSVFVALVVELGLSLSEEYVRSGLSYAFNIVNSLATIFGNLRTAFFQYPAGSIAVFSQ